jgi:hypothetical protein
MRKIANTTELTSELKRLLAYAGSHQPSRAKLASELRDLSMRVAVAKSSRVASDADSVLDKVERQLKSKFPGLHFSRDVEEDIDESLTVEPKDRDPDSSVVIVSVSTDASMSGVTVIHYGSGSSSSRGPEFDGADASKLTAAAIKLIEKHVA